MRWLAVAVMALAGPVAIVDAMPNPKSSETAAAPSPSQSTSPINLKTSGSKKMCDNEYVTDEMMSPEVRWDKLGCDGLVDYFDTQWKRKERLRLEVVDLIKNDENGWKLLFDKDWTHHSQLLASYPSEFVSFGVDGPENWQCQKIDDTPCNNPSISCEQTEHACGFLILNSLANIHKFYQDNLNAIQRAHDRIQDDIGVFSGVFCPEAKEFSGLLDLFNILSSLIPVYAGGLASIVSNSVKTAAEKVLTTGSGIAGSAMVRHAPSEQISKGDLENLMSSMLGKIYDAFRDNQEEYFENVFGRSVKKADLLWSMMRGGAFIKQVEGMDFKAAEREATALMYGALMTEAWDLSPLYGGIRPFFAKTGKCGTKPGLPATKAYSGQEICHDGDAWYFFIYESSAQGNGIHYRASLQEVPGRKELEDEDYVVSLQNIFDSAMGAYKKNGNKNGYKLDVEDMDIMDGVATPGYFRTVKICDDWGAMKESLRQNGWPC